MDSIYGLCAEVGFEQETTEGTELRFLRCLLFKTYFVVTFRFAPRKNHPTQSNLEQEPDNFDTLRLLMFALLMIGGFRPEPKDRGFHWNPPGRWLCKAQ